MTLCHPRMQKCICTQKVLACWWAGDALPSSMRRCLSPYCKRLWSPGIDSEESIPSAYVPWRAGYDKKGCRSGQPGWELIPELLKRLTNTGSVCAYGRGMLCVCVCVGVCCECVCVCCVCVRWGAWEGRGAEEFLIEG
jgi:hypothetical protein